MRSRLRVFGIATLACLAAAAAPLTSAAQSNYDGTGIWTLAECSEDCFFMDLMQTPRGDLRLRDGFCAEVDCHVEIVFRRQGRRVKTGGTGEYWVTIRGLAGDERECIDQEGIALLDASSDPNTLSVTVTGVNWQGPEVGCQPETNVIDLQR